MNEFSNLSLVALSVIEIGFAYFILPVCLFLALSRPPDWAKDTLLVLNFSFALSALPQLVMIGYFVQIYLDTPPQLREGMFRLGIGFPLMLAVRLVGLGISTAFFWHRMRSRWWLSVLALLHLQWGNLYYWYLSGDFSWDVAPWGYAPFLPSRGVCLVMNLVLLAFCYLFLQRNGWLSNSLSDRQVQEELDQLLSGEADPPA